MAKAKMSVLTSAGKRDIAVVALARLVSAISTLVLLVTLGQIVGEAASGTIPPSSRWIFPLITATIAGLGAFSEIFIGGVAARAEERRLRHRLLSTVFTAETLPQRNEEEFDSARLLSLMTDNVERFTEYRQGYFGATLAAIAIPFAALTYVAVAIDPVVGLVLLLMCPLIPVLIGGFMHFFRKTSSRSRQERAKLSGQYLDAIRNLVVIRLFGAGPRIEQNLREQGESNRGAIMKLLAGNQIVIIVVDGLFSLLFICMAAALAVTRFDAGAITATQAVIIMLLTTLLIEPLVQIAGFFYIGMGGIASKRAISRYLSSAADDNQTASRPQNNAESTPAPDPKLAVQIADLRFDYGRGPVLRGINLNVPYGSRIGIIGRSGEGKSTLLSVLRGSLPLQDGSVAIDGRILCGMEPTDIRQLTASVSQQTWLFTGTIADNLLLAAPKATEEQIWDALESAQVADDVRQMPHGLHTDVGEQGMLVSGGQAQRISLARALLSGRRILLLDEPTSQVDIESEAHLIDALAKLGPEWTLIMVTHRQKLLQVADRVLELESGVLNSAEKGTR